MHRIHPARRSGAVLERTPAHPIKSSSHWYGFRGSVSRLDLVDERGRIVDVDARQLLCSGHVDRMHSLRRQFSLGR